MKRRDAEIKVTAIVPSAGRGARFKSKERKIFANLNRRPLLSYSLKSLQSSPLIRDIVLVVDKRLIEASLRLIRHYHITKVKHVIEGGRTRTESVRKGLHCVDKDSSLVLIHDGVRPFVSKEVIERTILAAKRFGASVSAVPVKATIKFSGKGSFVRFTPNRAQLWEVQTPQVFKRALIEDAYKNIDGNRFFTPLDKRGSRNRRRNYLTGFTDDAGLVEGVGKKVKIVKGDYRNIKITTVEDIKIAEALLRSREYKRNQKPEYRNQNSKNWD